MGVKPAAGHEVIRQAVLDKTLIEQAVLHSEALRYVFGYILQLPRKTFVSFGIIPFSEERGNVLNVLRLHLPDVGRLIIFVAKAGMRICDVKDMTNRLPVLT